MLKAIYSNKFVKQYKRAIKRGIKTQEIDEILRALARQEKLAPRYRDHSLTGNFVGLRECHIKNDYLLIYRYEPGAIKFEQLGTHSDLFK